MGKIVLLVAVFAFISLVSAGHSIDISGLKTDDYSLGEEINFKVILLKEGVLVNQNVNVLIYDVLQKKEIAKIVPSGQDVKIKVEGDFPSGIWTILANYSDVEVERNFIIGENFEVEFLIEGDELTIRNIGNVRYTKAVQIKIGGETNTYVQNIGVGEKKVLKLISPDGAYDIAVTDGKTTLKRENVELHGTGNVVGAINKDLMGYTGLAGADKLDSGEDERFLSLDKLPLALIFVGAVGILIILVITERRLAKRANHKKD